MDVKRDFIIASVRKNTGFQSFIFRSIFRVFINVGTAQFFTFFSVNRLQSFLLGIRIQDDKNRIVIFKFRGSELKIKFLVFLDRLSRPFSCFDTLWMSFVPGFRLEDSPNTNTPIFWIWISPRMVKGACCFVFG